jgi:hypothetical protein
MMTVHESYLAAALSQIDERYASVDAWLEKEYQLTPQAREALQSRLLEGNPLPFSGCRARVDGLHSRSQEKM